MQLKFQRKVEKPLKIKKFRNENKHLNGLKINKKIK